MASGVEGALRRLDQALDQLEAAAEGRIRQQEHAEQLRREVQTLSADRSRLADSLDKAEARAARLEGVNRDASRRIVTAVETIRSVLQAGPERQ